MVDHDRWTPWRISPTRSCALAALGAVLLLAACRTAAPAKPATDDATRIPAAPPVTYVPFAPMVLVAQGEHAFVLLHATVGGVGDGGLSFGAAYVAATDPTAAVADDAPRRAVAFAAILLEAISPMLPPHVRQAEVAAIYGAPGTVGLAVPARVARDGARWGDWHVDAPRRVLVPPLPPQLARHAPEERAAVAVARAFLGRIDAQDGDAAWELASAAVKVSTSRQSFEEALWPEGWKIPRLARRELFRQYEVHGPDFTLGDLVLVCFASDAGVEVVQLRLDDDQEWRVATFLRPVPTGERSIPQPQGPSLSVGASPSPVHVSGLEPTHF